MTKKPATKTRVKKAVKRAAAKKKPPVKPAAKSAPKPKKRPSAQEREAVRIAKEIIAMGGLSNAMKQIERLKVRQEANANAVPMTTVLAKVPWDAKTSTIVARAKKLQVARQTYYDWLSGKARPNWEQAGVLADLTGYTREQIRGAAPLGRPKND